MKFIIIVETLLRNYTEFAKLLKSIGIRFWQNYKRSSSANRLKICRIVQSRSDSKNGYNITNRFSAIVVFVRVVLQKYIIAEISLGRSGFKSYMVNTNHMGHGPYNPEKMSNLTFDLLLGVNECNFRSDRWCLQKITEIPKFGHMDWLARLNGSTDYGSYSCEEMFFIMYF